jgi:hypothetical protein
MMAGNLTLTFLALNFLNDIGNITNTLLISTEIILRCSARRYEIYAELICLIKHALLSVLYCVC